MMPAMVISRPGLVAANLKAGVAGGVPQLAEPKDAQSAEMQIHQRV